MSIARQNICYCHIFPLDKFFDERFSDIFEVQQKHQINELANRSQKREPKHAKKMTKCCLCIYSQSLSLQVDLGPYCLY